MKYRPIGIAPLRNYGWELSRYLRAPSRQVERFGKKIKRHEWYLLRRTDALLHGGRGQSKRADSQLGARRVARWNSRSVRGVSYAVTSAIATNHL